MGGLPFIQGKSYHGTEEETLTEGRGNVALPGPGIRKNPKDSLYTKIGKWGKKGVLDCCRWREENLFATAEGRGRENPSLQKNEQQPTAATQLSRPEKRIPFLRMGEELSKKKKRGKKREISRGEGKRPKNLPLNKHLLEKKVVFSPQGGEKRKILERGRGRGTEG